MSFPKDAFSFQGLPLNSNLLHFTGNKKRRWRLDDAICLCYNYILHCI